MTQRRALAIGEVFVNHRIEGLAGRGGMGVVYRATDLELDRLVALKVIAPGLAEHADFRSRFVAESKAAASIEHPHVIPVYYAGQREGLLFIVMRYVHGPDLRALVRVCGPLEPGGPRGSSRRSAMRSTPRTRAVSSIVTSSPRTSCSTPTITRTSRTSASRSAQRRPARRRRPADGPARRAISRRSRSAASASTRARTSTRSAAFSSTR